MEDTQWVLRALVEAGWIPDNPSPECRDAMSRPQMPDHLTEADKEGIHWRIISLRLLSRFQKKRDWKPDRVEALQRAAVGFVAASAEDPSTKSLDGLRVLLARLVKWDREVYWPAAGRLEGCASLEDCRRCEPAFSHGMLVNQLDLVDEAAHMKQIKWGLSKHYQGKLTVKKPSKFVGLENPGPFFSFLTEHAGDRKPVAYFDQHGHIQLDPGRIKTVMDGVAGRFNERGELALDDLGPKADSEPSVDLEDEQAIEAVRAVQSQESVETVRAAIEQRLGEVEEGSGRYWADLLLLAWIESGKADTPPQNEWASQHGLSAPALSEALLAEREVLRRRVPGVWGI